MKNIITAALVASSLCLTASFASIASNKHSAFTMNSDGTTIRIHSKYNQDDTVYEVNGKRFTWKELSKDQQAQVSQLMEDIKSAERKFQAQEKKLSAWSKKIDKKAKEIQEQAEKLEQQVVKVEKKALSLKDLEKIQAKMEVAMAKKEKVLQQKEKELQELEKMLDKVDLSMTSDIDTAAEQLEATLIKIAESM